MNTVAERLYSSHFYELMDYACNEFPIIDAEHALTRMLVDLKRCPAKTDLGFRKWARAFIRQRADEVLDEQVSSIEQVVEIAQRLDTEPRPPFIAEMHPARPDVTFVKIERGRGGRNSSIWIVPTDLLPLAQVLHPTVAVRFTRIANRQYAYLIKKCQRQSYNGAWSTVERDLAAIWLGTDRPIEAVDGNYLNFLPENLRIFQAKSEDALNQAVPLWDEKDTFDWKPAVATAVASNKIKNSLLRKPTSHDFTVTRWLKGDSEMPADVAARQLRQAWGVSV